MIVYLARFKHGRKWSDKWHVVKAYNRDEALGKFLKGTRYTPAQVQIKIRPIED